MDITDRTRVPETLRVQAAPVAPATEVTPVGPVSHATASSWQPGSLVEAYVARRLDAVRVLATIGGERWILRLGGAAEPGTTLALQVLTIVPKVALARVSAGMDRSARGVPLVTATQAGTAGETGSRPVAGGFDSDPAVAPGATGGAARYALAGALVATATPSLADLVATAADADPPVSLRLGTPVATDSAGRPPACVHSGTVLLANPDSPPHEVAARLAETLSHSGLFYESHQAEWVSGRLALGAVMRSPQAAGSEAPARTQSGTAPPDPTAPGREFGRDPVAADPRLAVAVDGSGLAHTIAEQQLELLRSGQLSWNGYAWKGQRVEIAIGAPPAGGRPDERSWSTRMTLELPGLGHVEVALALRGNRLALDVTAPPGGAGALQQQRRALVERLRGHSLDVVALAIREGADAQP